jgi:sarcosine oxidase, subunit alpha
VFELVIRRSAGLGAARPPRPQPLRGFLRLRGRTGRGRPDCRAGRGPRRGGSGARVLLVEQTPHWGGRALADEVTIDGRDGPDWVADTLYALDAMPGVTRHARTMAAGVYDHGYVLAEERPATPRRRHWRIRARIVTATGAIERPLAFAGNDLPGVMLASAVRDYIALWGVSPGDRAVLITAGRRRIPHRTRSEGGRTRGARGPRRTAPRRGRAPEAARAAGIGVAEGRGVGNVKGRRRVTGVEMCVQAGEGAVIETIA